MPPAEPALIERAAAADAAALAAIFLRCWRIDYRGVVDDAVIDGLDAERIEGWWRTLVAGGQVLVARSRGAAVGMVRYGADEADPTRGHVFSLYVDPAAAGAGIGRRLLGRAGAELAAAGYRVATLWVFAANARALRFYRAAGWSPTGATRVEPEWRALELELATQLA